MLKKLVGLMLSVSLLLVGGVFGYASATPNPQKEELKKLHDQSKALHSQIISNIKEQKSIIEVLKKGVVKIDEATLDKEVVKAKNKEIRDKIKAMKQANSSLNTSRKTLLEQVKALKVIMKELRADLKEANTAKDKEKKSELLGKMVTTYNDILKNVGERSKIRAQMTVNMNGLK